MASDINLKPALTDAMPSHAAAATAHVGYQLVSEAGTSGVTIEAAVVSPSGEATRQSVFLASIPRGRSGGSIAFNLTQPALWSPDYPQATATSNPQPQT